MEKYEEILNALNTPLIPEENIILTKHKIFQKYTSKPYYQYAFDLLDTLCQKTNYENKKKLIHNAFTYLTFILYNCENIPYLSNFDLMILCCFYLSVKVIVRQNMVPGLTKFKRIYSEKFMNYKNEEIIKAEIICIKLLKYRINFLTVYDCLYCLLNHNKDMFNLALNKFENEKMLNIKEYMNKKPLDLAKEIIQSIDKKIKIKYPKIIKKKFIPNSNININKPKYHPNAKLVHIYDNSEGRVSHNINYNIPLYNKYSTITNAKNKKVSFLFQKTENHFTIYTKNKNSSKKNKNKSNVLNSSNLVNSFSNMDIELNSSPFNKTNYSSSPCGSDGLSSFVNQNNSGIKIINNSPIEIFKKPCLSKKNMKTSFNFNKKNNNDINNRYKNFDIGHDKILEESPFDKKKNNSYLSSTFYFRRKIIDNKNRFNFQ